MSVGVDSQICKKVNCQYYKETMPMKKNKPVLGIRPVRCMISEFTQYKVLSKGKHYKIPIPSNCPYKAIMITMSKQETL